MAKTAAAEDDADTKDAELEGSRMPFLSHLRELRDRVKYAALFFVLAFGFCFYFAQEIYDWLQVPIESAWLEVAKKKPELPAFKMSFATLTEPFWVNMSVALWAGIFVASPFIFYHLWKFIAPGLYKRERRITVAFAFFSAIFFVSGALFCYHFVLERIYEFLLGYANKDTVPTIMLQGYLDLTRDMMLAFGAVFELPLLIYFLSMIGTVTHRGLWKFNRWFVVIAFVVGAILTPSPDVVSQIMMATPMIALYNISIIISYIVTRRREKAEEELRERERIADEAERAEIAKKKAAQSTQKQLDKPDDDIGD